MVIQQNVKEEMDRLFADMRAGRVFPRGDFGNELLRIGRQIHRNDPELKGAPIELLHIEER